MHLGEKANLFLDNTLVGKVVVRRVEDSWGYGSFEPNGAFAKFAELFGRWSLLMHADIGARKLSEAASDELRATEHELDRLRARLYFPDVNRWVRCVQINIDGGVVEWKEY